MMPGFMVFLEDYDVFGESISNEELGEAIRALTQYAKTGEEQEGLSPMAASFFRLFKGKMDRQEKKYAAQVANSKKAAEAKAQQQAKDIPTDSQPLPNDIPTDTQPSPNEGKPITYNLKPNNNIVSSKGVVGGEDAPDGATTTHKRGKFEPPTLEEAQAYAREKGMDMDVEKFMAFYETNGWKVGRNPMKNWHSAMVYWHKNNSQRAREPTRYVPPEPSNRGLEDWDR